MKRFLLLLLLFPVTANAAPKPKTALAFEPKAHTLLKKVFARYRGLRSYSGAMNWKREGTSGDTLETSPSEGQAQIRWAQSKMFLRSKIKGGDFQMRFVDDGENVYANIIPGEVLRMGRLLVTPDDVWKSIRATEFGIRPLLQNKNPLQPYGSYVRSIRAGKSERRGEAHIIVQLEAPTARAQISYFLGEADTSLRRVRVHQVVDGKTLDASEEHLSIAFNPKIPSSELEADAEMKRLAEESRLSTNAKTPRE